MRSEINLSQKGNSERKRSWLLSKFQPGRCMARTQRLFYSWDHCWEQGVGNLFQGGGVPFLLSKEASRAVQYVLSRVFLCELFSPLISSVISSAAVTILFLMQSMFPVNCSYLNPCSLPFVPPVCCKEEGREEQVAHSFSGSTKWVNSTPKPWHFYILTVLRHKPGTYLFSAP